MSSPMPSLNHLSLYPLALATDAQALSTNAVPTLLAISHSLEDVVTRYRLRTPFYAGFQRLSAFLPQLNRFGRLAAAGGEVLVFAYPDVPVPDLPGVTLVPLAEDAPLTAEWFIVVDDPAFSAALLTRQMGAATGGPIRALEFGRGRDYAGLLTFQPALATAARAALDQALGRPPAPAATAPTLNAPQHFFQSTLLHYLEQRSRQIIGLYQNLNARHTELERLQGEVRKLVSQTAWEKTVGPTGTLNAVTTAQPTAQAETLTILFTDIQGFTRLATQVPPPTLFAALNRYLDLLAATVYQSGGDVDKFLGDGMLAFFRDPARAVQAGQRLQKRLAAFNAQQTASLQPTFPTRLALATGPCLMAHIGSRDRQEITVLGEAVNLASRLQALAPAGGLLLDDATYAAQPQPPAALRRLVNIKGLAGLQTVYEIDLTEPVAM